MSEAMLLGQPRTLERLAYAYASDKGRDDHKYVDLYASLFPEADRTKVSNVTEIGVFRGASIQLWARYFTNAHVWGLDLTIDKAVRASVKELGPRVHLFAGSAYNESTPSQLGLEPETMDIFVDDAAHDTASMESALRVWWPLVKPGGYYIMEDIEWQRGVYGVLGEPLRPFTQRVFAESAAFFADTTLGHRNWSAYQNRSCPPRERVRGKYCYARNHVLHNCHVAVLRKPAAAGDSPPGGERSGPALDPTLDQLADACGSNKGRVGDKSVDMYGMLLGGARETVRNVTELGTRDGSAAMWLGWFRNATVWSEHQGGGSYRLKGTCSHAARHASRRLRPIESGALPARQGLDPGSMDLVVHRAEGTASMEAMLHAWWPLVRPRGYYVVEGVSWRDGVYSVLEEELLPETQRIMSTNAAFFADATLGKERGGAVPSHSGPRCKDPQNRTLGCNLFVRVFHDRKMVVIRKRSEDEGPPPPFTITYGDRHAGDPSLHHVTVSSLMSRAG